MIFSTQNQMNCFLIFVFLGINFYLFYSFFAIIFSINFGKILKKIIFDSIFYAFFAIIFIIFLILFNFGCFSLSLIFAVLIGSFWSKLTFQKSVVFFKNLCYNIKNKKKRGKENANLKTT